MIGEVPGGTPVRRRVLVVEDDPGIADAVARRLRSEGYDVDTVHDGPAAVAAVLGEGPATTAAPGGAAAGDGGGGRYDAVVLDVMLPGLDGLEVCRRIQARIPVPVLMLTARAEEADRLVGLAVGADDYLAKPFSPRELVARVAALLRRVDRAAQLAAAGRAPGGGLHVGAVHVDPGTRRACVAGAEVHLTRTEFDLLACLAARPGAVLSRGRLIADVWQWEGAVPPSATRMLDSHVKALRRKIGAERIRTVHGVGYALEERP